MATTEKLSKYEVVYFPGGDLHCRLCEDILFAPQYTTCCKSQCCMPCIQMSVVSEAPCPFCKSRMLAVRPHVKLQDKLDLLLIKCSNFKKGCDWEGQMGKLQVHLDRTCLYTLEKCSQGCEMILERKRMEEHKMTTCIHRKEFCQECGREFTSIKMESHVKKCIESKKNGRIQKKRIEKELGMTACPYNIAGCSEVMDIGKIAGHLQSSVHKHEWLETTLSHYINHMKCNHDKLMKQLTEQKLKLQKAEIALANLASEAGKLKQEKKVLKCEHELALKNLRLMEVHLCEKNQEIIGLTNKLSSHNPQVKKRTTFSLADFSKLQEKATWTSDCFFTHQNGYKLCVKVDCQGGNIRLRLHILPGPNDDDLQWPIQGTITLSIMNQAQNKHHLHNTFIYDNKTSLDTASRVMTGESSACFSSPRGLPLSDLRRTADTGNGPIYIMNNTILIEVTNCELEITC